MSFLERLFWSFFFFGDPAAGDGVEGDLGNGMSMSITASAESSSCGTFCPSGPESTKQGNMLSNYTGIAIGYQCGIYKLNPLKICNIKVV